MRETLQPTEKKEAFSQIEDICNSLKKGYIAQFELAEKRLNQIIDQTPSLTTSEIAAFYDRLLEANKALEDIRARVKRQKKEEMQKIKERAQRKN